MLVFENRKRGLHKRWSNMPAGLSARLFRGARGRPSLRVALPVSLMRTADGSLSESGVGALRGTCAGEAVSRSSSTARGTATRRRGDLKWQGARSLKRTSNRRLGPGWSTAWCHLRVRDAEVTIDWESNVAPARRHESSDDGRHRARLLQHLLRGRRRGGSARTRHSFGVLGEVHR